MAAIYSNGGNRWNILVFNFTKRDALSSLYKIYMILTKKNINAKIGQTKTCFASNRKLEHVLMNINYYLFNVQR
jgi:hypothetical protein